NKQLPSQNKLINTKETDNNIYGEFNDASKWKDDNDSKWEDKIDFEKEKDIQLKLLRKGL
ncbi:11977_t:CDS:1, partial [Funneliformis mosseae]